MLFRSVYHPAMNNLSDLPFTISRSSLCPCTSSAICRPLAHLLSTLSCTFGIICGNLVSLPLSVPTELIIMSVFSHTCFRLQPVSPRVLSFKTCNPYYTRPQILVIAHTIVPSSRLNFCHPSTTGKKKGSRMCDTADCVLPAAYQRRASSPNVQILCHEA